MKFKRYIASFLIFMLFFSFIPFASFAGSGGAPKAEVRQDPATGIQYFGFSVKTTTSSAGIKYQSVGWNIKVDINKDGTIDKTKKVPMDTFYDVSSGVTQRVDMKLDDLFDLMGLTASERLKSGRIYVDGIFIVKKDGNPVTTDGKAAPSGWEDNDTLVLSSNIRLFETLNAILDAPRSLYGVSWSTQTQNDLPTFFDIDAPYAATQTLLPVDLNLTVKSTLGDHTIDLAKGKTKATTIINATTTIHGTNDYTNNPSNIDSVSITIKGQTKIVPGPYTSLTMSMDFNFTDTTATIKDGDILNYVGTVTVSYKDSYFGNATDSVDVPYKVMLIDGKLVAVINAPNEATVGIDVTADGLSSIVPPGATITNYKWSIEGVDAGAGATKSSIQVTSATEKTVTVGLEVTDSKGNKDSTTHDIIFKKSAISPPPSNFAPEVSINAPTYIMMGDDFTLSVHSSDTEDGQITPTISKPSTLVGNVQLGDNRVHFNQVGTYAVSAHVVDSGGLEDDASATIEVLPPIPLAVITENGAWKIGHTMMLDATKSQAISNKYPIDHTKTTWSFKPLGSLTDGDIFTKKISDTHTAFTSKKTGQVEVTLTVYNTAGYSNSRIITRTIVADQGPIADFIAQKTTYRDETGNANIQVVDNSESPDGDLITKRVWTYGYDANNDGQFSDDPWYVWTGTKWQSITYAQRYTIASSYNNNDVLISVPTKNVGMYMFELSVYENHNDRITEFIVSSYILSDNTSDKTLGDKYTNLDNLAPVASVKVDVAGDNNYDFVVVTDYEGAELIALQSELNVMKAQMFTQGRNANIHLLTDKIKLGKQHVIKNYNTYARYVNINYWVTGQTQVSTQELVVKNYLRDPRVINLEYETTQGYVLPTLDFIKGHDVSLVKTSFSNTTEGTYSNGQMTGAEFQAFNPNNKAGTILTTRVDLDGWFQGLGFAFVYKLIMDEYNHTIENIWKPTGRYTPHDYYYDVYGMDFSKVQEVAYQPNSKKVFFYFTKGSNTNYEIGQNTFTGASIDQSLVDYLKKNKFEHYVIPSNTSILDWKIGNKEFNTDISTQKLTLKELAHSSVTRGKVLNKTSWKDSIQHLTNKTVSLPNDLKVENNVITITPNFNLYEGDTLNLTMIQEYLRLSDAFGNINTTDKTVQELTVTKGKDDIRELSSLIAEVPRFSAKSKNLDIVRLQVAENYNLKYVIYRENEQEKIYVFSGDANISSTQRTEINSTDWSNVKQVVGDVNFIAILFKDGSLKYYGKTSYYYLDPIILSNWTNVTKIASGKDMLVGLRSDNSIVAYGFYLVGRRGDYYEQPYNGKVKDAQFYGDVGNVGPTTFYVQQTTSSDSRSNNYFTSDSMADGYWNLTETERKTVKFISGGLGNAKLIDIGGIKRILLAGYNGAYESINVSGKTFKEIALLNNTASSAGQSYWIGVTTDNDLYIPPVYEDYLKTYNTYIGDLSTYVKSIGKVKDTFYQYNGYLSYVVIGESGSFALSVNGLNRLSNEIYYKYTPLEEVKNIAVDAAAGSYGTINQYNNNVAIISESEPVANKFKNIDGLYKYTSDSYGYAYLTKDGTFTSHVYPSYSGASFDYRKVFSGAKYKQVILDNIGAFIMVLNNNGKVSFGYNTNGNYTQYQSLNNLIYYNDISELVYTSYGVMAVGKGQNYLATINGTTYPSLTGYNGFPSKNIKQYESKYDSIYGLAANGEVYQTSASGLVLVASDVQKIYKLGGEIIYLKNDGTLSKYGSGITFEPYLNLQSSLKAIIFKIKGTNTLATVTPFGVELDYYGALNVARDIDPLIGKTQLTIGPNSKDGVEYRYKIFTSNIDSVPEILKNELIDKSQWLICKNGDKISVDDGYYIGVVELDASGKAIAFSITKAKTNK